MVSVEVETKNIDSNMATDTDACKEIKEENDKVDTPTENIDMPTDSDKIDIKEENGGEENDEVDTPTENIDIPADSDKKDIKVENDAPSILEAKIIRQLEYYFGDVNLWRDKFLKEKVTEDDGWVTIECLTTFNRLKSLSTDFEEIANALRKSTSGLMEVHEDNTKVRRSPSRVLPDPEEPTLRKTSKMKRLYLKGFPTSYSLDDVQEFIMKQGCQPVFTKLKRDDDKKFKGSIIMEVTTLEEASKLLNNEVKCEETVLTVMRRDDYFDQKNEKRRSSGRKDYGDRTEKKEDTEDMEPPKLGCVLHFKGAVNETSREDLKEVFGPHGEVEWVDFNRGDVQGYVRFKEAGGAKKAIDAIKAANDGKLIIKEAECDVKVIEGIEEKNYWILANEERKRPRQRFQNNRGRRGNRKDRGQENWRKRRRPWEYKPDNADKSQEKSENKHTKFDKDGNDGNTDKGDKSGDNIGKKDNLETSEKKVKLETAVET